VLIRRGLGTLGRTDITEVAAFTDRCPNLRMVLANAGVTRPPIVDRFPIAMHLQHAKLAATNLASDTPERVLAKAVIVAEVESLHGRIWNGKAKNAQRSIRRIRKVMPVFKSKRRQGAKGIAAGKLWHALHAIDNTSKAKRHGWSTTPNDFEPVCGSGRRSPKAQQTSWSTGV
jgi:hypothetical protein